MQNEKNKKLTAVLSAVGVLSTGVGPHVGARLYPEDNEHVYHEMSVDFTKKQKTQKTQNYETFSISSRRSEKMIEKKDIKFNRLSYLFVEPISNETNNNEDKNSACSLKKWLLQNENNVSVQLTNTTEENNRKAKLYKHQNDLQNKEVELCKLILKIVKIDETVSNKTISQKKTHENNILQELCKLTAIYLNNIDINSSKKTRYKLSIGLAFSALDFLNKKKDQKFQSSPSRNNCEQSIEIWNTWLMKQCVSVRKTSFYTSFNCLMKKTQINVIIKYLLEYAKHRQPELFQKAQDMIQQQKSEDKPGKESTSSVRRSSRLNNVKDTVQSKGHQVLRLVTETKRK